MKLDVQVATNAVTHFWKMYNYVYLNLTANMHPWSQP